MLLMQVITETIFGAITGYLTNDFAIRELFKDGGIVEQTRNDFTREASALLEEKILTAEVLQEQLEQPEVQAAIQQLLEHFLVRDLPQHLAQYQVGDLAELATVEREVQQYICKLWQEEKGRLMERLQDALGDRKLLSAAQQERLSEVALYIAEQELTEGRYVAKALRQWREAHGEATWEETEWGIVLQQAMAAVKPLVIQWKEDWYSQEQEKLRLDLADLLQRLDFSGALAELEAQSRKKTLQDYLAIDAGQLVEKIQIYLRSNEGEALLALLTGKLLVALGEIRLPLKELLPMERLQAMTPFLLEQIEQLLQLLVEWLEENQIVLSEMLDEGVAEVFATYDGVQGFILQFVKEALLKNILQEYGILAKLQQRETSQQAVQHLLSCLEHYFAEQPFGDLVEQVLSGERGRKLLAALLRENLLFYLEQYGETKLQDWMDKPIGQWLQISWAEQYGAELERIVRDELWQYGELLDLAPLLDCFGERILGKKVNATLDEQRLEQGQQWAEKHIGYLRHSVEQALDRITAEQLLTLLVDAVGRKLEQLEQPLQGIKQKPMDSLYQNVMQKQWTDGLVAEGQLLIEQKLVGLTNGTLSALAKQQLDQRSNEEIRVLVQDFMGRKLKSLNYLGAGMGSVVGLATGIGMGQLDPALLQGSLGATGGYAAGKSFIFGALGYGTNCAALKGLFWPYRPIAGLEPLQGIIPRQQKSFARSMGNMVEHYVVNEEILQEVLLGKGQGWVAQSAVLGANPVVWREISAKLLEKEEDFCLQGQLAAGKMIQRRLPFWLDRLGQRPLASFYPEELSQQGERYYLPLLNRMVSSGHDFLHSEMKVQEIISAAQLSTLVQKLIAKAELPEITVYWQKFSQRDLCLGDLMPEKQMEQLLNGLFSLAEEKLLGGYGVAHIVRGINRFLGEESLGTAFGGQLSIWLEHNLQKLLQLIFRQILSLLEGRKEELTLQVQQKIASRLNFMQQMGYALMHGDQLVAEVMDKIIQEKVPAFLGLKQHEIGEVVMQYWTERLAPVALQDIQLQIDPAVVQRILQQLMTQPTVRETQGELVAMLVQQGESLALQPWLEKVVLDDELQMIQQWLDQHWQAERQSFGQSLAAELQPFLQQQFAQVTIADFFLPWSEQLITEQWIQQQLEQLGLAQLWQEIYPSLLTKAGSRELQDYLLWPELTREIIALEQCFRENAVTRQWLGQRLTGEVHFAIVHFEEKVPLAMREQIVQWVVSASLDTLYQDGADVLRQLDLGNLTERQVLAMDARELETLVWSFARQYLTHIQNMGWMGAGFALPGILLTVLN